MTTLETTDQPENLRRIAIDPVSRVEGHGKVTLLVDDQQQVRQARFHIVEFRGFERFIQGRPYWELPMVVQRLCGICPVSHHLVAGKAIDMLIGVNRLTPSAEKLRRLLHLGQVLQSHALHFFHLASPDLLFGFDAQLQYRNVIELLARQPDVAMKGVKLRKFGQQLIEAICGKRVHGSLVIPGGVNKSLQPQQLQALQQQCAQIRPWAEQAVTLAKAVYLADPRNQHFGAVSSPLLSLVTANGNFELYDGGLRASTMDAQPIFDHLDNRAYGDHILEEVKAWSYMKFPFFKSLGKDQGWYRVGPLARLLNCDQMDQPAAEQARQELLAHCDRQQPQSALLYHWARMVELLYCAEAIEQALQDDDLCGRDLVVAAGTRQSECIGVLEAPRGTLIHHYRVNDQDLVEKANLIVSTTSNNQAMNESIRDVCEHYLNGREIDEPLLNHIEVAIRAYDPCLSCATHALGQMPLVVERMALDGTRLDAVSRDSSGRFERIDG